MHFVRAIPACHIVLKGCEAQIAASRSDHHRRIVKQAPPKVMEIYNNMENMPGEHINE
jgi:hypothetical protein